VYAWVGICVLQFGVTCIATGLQAEAVAVLQEAREWRYAAALMASALQPEGRAAALERWAMHVLEA
jgi:hypothetical protein